MPAPTYLNCNESQKNQGQKAYNEVRFLLGKANSAIISLQKYSPGQNYEPKDIEEADRFFKWFGSINTANLATVRDRVIYPMVRQLENNSVTIECGGADCERRDFAYVTAPGAGLGVGIIINLCEAFFTAPLYGTNSQVGTLLHEISHLVGNTNDHKYGQSRCLELAKTNPLEAINNADNYEYYLESFHY
ncbi:M35 family metallopeptidase [Kamptonema formosum]|uniref:M35 family metallopeptidase n=1 Tax=Kamptonema formosum TaxID=331992 RepID=UPI000368B349|nr:M35 family metallopeptidase [Oscillatoria sp. PCC 10802]